MNDENIIIYRKNYKQFRATPIVIYRIHGTASENRACGIFLGLFFFSVRRRRAAARTGCVSLRGRFRERRRLSAAITLRDATATDAEGVTSTGRVRGRARDQHTRTLARVKTRSRTRAHGPALPGASRFASTGGGGERSRWRLATRGVRTHKEVYVARRRGGGRGASGGVGGRRGEGGAADAGTAAHAEGNRTRHRTRTKFRRPRRSVVGWTRTPQSVTLRGSLLCTAFYTRTHRASLRSRTNKLRKNNKHFQSVTVH